MCNKAVAGVSGNGVKQDGMRRGNKTQPQKEAETVSETVMEPRLFSRKQAMAYIGLCSTSLWQLEKDGELAAVRLGKRVLFDRADLDRFIDRNKRKSR